MKLLLEFRDFFITLADEGDTSLDTIAAFEYIEQSTGVAFGEQTLSRADSEVIFGVWVPCPDVPAIPFCPFRIDRPLPSISSKAVCRSQW